MRLYLESTSLAEASVLNEAAIRFDSEQEFLSRVKSSVNKIKEDLNKKGATPIANVSGFQKKKQMV